MITQETDIEKAHRIVAHLDKKEDTEVIEEHPPYCIELKEMWDQFVIKWETSTYSKGWVRMGDINLASISFWKESPHWYYDKPTEPGYQELSTEQIEWSELVDHHISGYYIRIINLRSGEELINYKIDFGGDAYVHKKKWSWANDYQMDAGDLIKKAARAWGFIEAWCM